MPQQSSKDGRNKQLSTAGDVGRVKQVSGGRRVQNLTTQLIDSNNPSTGLQSTFMSDPHSVGTWDIVKEVPPCETNNSDQPIGRFWEHMKGSYTRGPLGCLSGT